MTRLTFSLLALVGISFLSAASASAQGFGLVQNDYDRYTQLFKVKKEPNLSHHPKDGSASWRKLYRDHNWKGYAEETEHREPLLAAQVLMGIYLTSFVDHELTYQIDGIVLHAAHFSNALAENIALDKIGKYMQDRDISSNASDSSSTSTRTGEGMDFYSSDEINNMQRLGRDIDVIARERMVSGRGITRRQEAEIRGVQNLFYQDVRDRWADTYYSMGEKLRILDGLADSFAFNWDEERREAELGKLIESPRVQRLAEERTRHLRATAAGGDPYGDPFGTGDGGGFEEGGMIDPSLFGMSSAPEGGLTEEDIQRIKEEMPRIIAEEMLKAVEARHTAFKYIVGVYQSTDYHLDTLRKVYRYYLTTAKQGDPIAQYHLALFLRYLGEFLGMDKGDAEHEAQEWLNKAATSDLAKRRVDELNTHFALESRNEDKNEAMRERRLAALRKVEDEKLSMIETVLERVAKKIGRGSTGSSGTGTPR